MVESQIWGVAAEHLILLTTSAGAEWRMDYRGAGGSAPCMEWNLHTRTLTPLRTAVGGP